MRIRQSLTRLEEVYMLYLCNKLLGKGEGSEFNRRKGIEIHKG